MLRLRLESEKGILGEGKMHRKPIRPALFLPLCFLFGLMGRVVGDQDPLVDPDTGLPMTSRPTAYGRYLNSRYLNVASSHNGGKTHAAYAQEGFWSDASIDGVTTGEYGWAYLGRLDKAICMYTFKKSYRVSQIRVLSGVSRFTDHHVTAMQIWFSNHSAAMLPPSVHWFPHYHWHPIRDLQSVTLDTVVVGNRIFTNGEEEVVLRFSPVFASSMLLKIDAADSPSNNAVVTEFEVFTADPNEPSAPQPTTYVDYVDHSWVSPPPKNVIGSLLGGGSKPLLLPSPETDVVPLRLWEDRTKIGGNKTRSPLTRTFSMAAKDLGFDPSLQIKHLTNGRWFTPLHPTVNYLQPHIAKGSKAAAYCVTDCAQTPLATEGAHVHVPPDDTCKAINGSEILFIGDTRMRHTFLSAIAYFRGAALRGFVNPSHAGFWGARYGDGGFWHPQGRGESCGESMPHGFELECAGVVNGKAEVCNGSVTLRLEETDDRSKALQKLKLWVSKRQECAASGACSVGTLTVVMSLVIPKIRSYSQATPAHPTVPLLNTTSYIQEALDAFEPLWASLQNRSEWVSEGRANAMRAILVWATVEPFAVTEPRHAQHNRNITHLNAEIRQLLDMASIPILDGFKIAIDRHDCHPDKLHWCNLVHNTKVGVLLTLIRQLTDKIKEEEAHWLTHAERDTVAARARERAAAASGQGVEDAKEEEKQEEAKKRKAADEARAKKIAEEQAAKRAKQDKIKDKFAKFDKARAAAKATPKP
eukprot:CAMPEP_0114127620 /NCGR_PEP_ID=MMETSP0043_2-20121206/10482_1 /TAXON_ID=464988 /ORGANISM="Hemiselmis andersenii, Strain CCMP644" /LENGTH=754 /DNA_ID=CAMNT_0001220727 /DNA_START=69 /DNA_END=2331 /DNA_ORIENTATION=-